MSISKKLRKSKEILYENQFLSSSSQKQNNKQLEKLRKWETEVTVTGRKKTK